MAKNRYWTGIVLCSAFLLILVQCNQGLMPPEIRKNVFAFPFPPEGGDPVGFWVPDTLKPVEVFLLNEETLPDVVDSLVVGSRMEGFFSFSITNSCSVYAVVTLLPSVYLHGLPPLKLTITDTLRGEGAYEVINDEAVAMPVHSNLFNLDTLGFSAYPQRMDLISLNNTFSYQGIMEIELYFLFHLERTPAGTVQSLTVDKRRQGEEG